MKKETGPPVPDRHVGVLMDSLSAPGTAGKLDQSEIFLHY